uniref:IST1-like protein n=1 Tax=Chenopodium quinoa TaxID=63459 RepID=A0A803MK98_CHEQI
MLHRGFKPAKCKTALNLAKSRIKLMKNRKDIQLKQLRREVAQLLDSGQDQTARIRVEHVIREEKMIAAYEMIEIYCELVVARLPIIESQKNCPLDLKEAIASLIFAAPRCGDIVELQDVRKHFTAKYGKEFATAAAEVRPACGVSRTLVEKLSVNAPDGQTKLKLLTAIAEEHNIKWEPNWFKDEDPVPSVDIPKVAVAQSMEGSKIQMQPLNYELADDLEENHPRDKVRPGTSSQSMAHTRSDSVPPSSIPHSDPRPSESSSEKKKFSQSSGTAEKMASYAARAAAELARRSNVMSDDHHHSAGSGLQQNHVHRNSTSGSFNQKSPRMLDQEDSYRQGNMKVGGDAINLNKDYTQYGGQYEAEKQDFTENKNSRRHTRDPESTPITNKPEDEYEIESSEHPFHEETVERKDHSRNFQSQSSVFEDEYSVFSNMNYDNKKHDSGDGYLGSFSRKTDDQEDWHARSTYTFDEEDTTFKSNHREENIFDSGNDVFVGMDHSTSGMGLDEKEIHTNSEVFFDESGSDDDDDKSVLNPIEEHNFRAPAEPTRIGSSINQDNHYFEPELSESFRRSPIYSKLTEPMSLNFDDSDGASSGNEEELQKDKFDPGVPSYDNQMPGADPHLELRSSNVEKGTTDCSMNSNHMEGKQYIGSSDSLYGNSSSALSTGFKSRSDYDVSYEGWPQKSLQSLRHSESRNLDSEVEYETQPAPDGGMGLNLGLLPGGRRNRAHGHMPKGRLADASSPSKSANASLSKTFGSSERASTYESQSSSSQIDNKQCWGEYRARSMIDGNTSKTSLKSSPRYFDSGDSSSEEDAPKPVVSKTFLGAGLSRRTKASAPRTVARSNASDTEKTRRSSGSYNTESSSSRIIGQSNRDDDQKVAAKSSEDVISTSSSVSEKPVTPKRPDVSETSNFNEKAPSRENSAKNPSHVHPKLPDFETLTAQLHSLRRNR